MNLKFQNTYVGILNLFFASNWEFNDRVCYSNCVLQYLRILNQTNPAMLHSE